MIQILGLRDYTTNGVQKKRETFFNKGWRLEKIQDVFSPDKLEEVLKEFAKTERYNLYFTVANCFEEPGRKLREQWAIPFDIDNLYIDENFPLKNADAAARCAARALGVPFEEMGVLFSGNGVQFFILLDKPIVSEEYFDQYRSGYALLCGKIQRALIEMGIQGTVDPSVWSKARLMRLPNTINRKPGKPERVATILNGTMVARSFDIAEQSGVRMLDKPEHISDTVLKNYPKPDTKAVCAGCKFLIHCKEKPNEITEPQWYASTSITSRLDDGRTLTHAYSEGHKGYNHYETENKIDQALAASGPRTCKNIESLWGGCTSCDYYGKVTSPIMIKGPDYIASADFGYRERKQDKHGRLRAGPPAYQDLVRAFAAEHPFKVVKDNDQVIIFNGRHWEYLSDREIHAWSMKVIRHAPSTAEMRELLGTIKAHNVTSIAELSSQVAYHINFRNYILNLRTMEVKTHAPEYGFFHVLPFDYDARAEAPTWRKFLEDVMCGDAELAQLLEEYAGYCISGDTCWLHKAILLIGDGANGKSVFMETLASIVGKDNRSSVPMQDIDKPTARYAMVNKLFNYSEETAVHALSDSSTFKNMVSGGEIQVKKLYENEYSVENRTKLIMSANTMPGTMDRTHGFMRRLVIVNFNQTYTPGDGKHDYFIKDKLLAERPGICNSLIAAYKNLQARGVLAAREKQEQALQEYRDLTDPVTIFDRECVEHVEDLEEWVLCTEVYEQYRIMCDMYGFKPVHIIHFGRQLARINSNYEVNKARRIVGTTRKYVYRGIKLNKEY